MIIRSQDRRTIVNFNNLTEVCIGGAKENKIEALDNRGVLELGTYSTEEIAIKVLDMIQDTYVRCESARTLSNGTLFELARNFNQEQVEEFKKGHRLNFVFQMPADEDVGV